MPKRETKKSFIDIVFNGMQNLFASEENSKKEKSEYYKNPFGGFLP
jgi:hypothetical protein